MEKAGEKARRAFLTAAEKLFAARGIDQVKLSEIAQEAGIDASMINYHFGGRDGLIRAVADDALGKWLENDMRQYYHKNKALLDSRDGRIIFITGLVECVFQNLGADPAKAAGQSLLLQLLERPHPMREEIIDRHIKPGVLVFCDIYRIITGDDDFESAFCWYLFLICPRYLYAACPGLIDLFHPQGRVSDCFDRRLQHFTTQILLNALGLL